MDANIEFNTEKPISLKDFQLLFWQNLAEILQEISFTKNKLKLFADISHFSARCPKREKFRLKPESSLLRTRIPDGFPDLVHAFFIEAWHKRIT